MESDLIQDVIVLDAADAWLVQAKVVGVFAEGVIVGADINHLGIELQGG